MKVIAFFILALLGTSYASQALTKSLDKIHSDPTGAAILSMISLNLKMKTPLGDVGDELNAIRDGLLADSQKFESDTANENERLSNAISNDEALKAAYESAIETLKSLIETSASSLATDEDSLSNNQQALASEEQAIQDRDAEYAERVPEYDKDLVDLEQAAEACRVAVQKMNAYKQSSEGSSTFLQMSTSIKEKIQKATDTMQGMRKKLSKYSNMFTPLIRELIDLSSSLDQSKADKVINLLTQLVELLTGAHAERESERASYIAEYEAKQQQSKENVANYEATIDQLEQAIQGLKDKIAQAQSDLAATEQNAADNQAKLEADQASLEALQADYAVRRTRYNNLISLVRQIIEYFQQHLGALDDYVASKINGSL